MPAAWVWTLAIGFAVGYVLGIYEVDRHRRRTTQTDAPEDNDGDYRTAQYSGTEYVRADLYTAAIEAKERAEEDCRQAKDMHQQEKLMREEAEARWQAGRDEDPPFYAQEFADCFEKSTSQQIMQEAYELGLERGRIQRIATLERELAAARGWK